MVETLIVLPVIILFILIIMEVTMLYNAKQVANYAAFCAARTASVYGFDSDEAKSRIHKAMALALIPISPKITSDVQAVIGNFTGPLGIPDGFFQAITQILGTPGDYLERYVDSYLRSDIKNITLSNNNQNIEVNIKYYYRCRIFPMGILLGRNGFSNFINQLMQSIPGLPNLSGFLNWINYNILITSSARMDYWYNRGS